MNVFAKSPKSQSHKIENRKTKPKINQININRPQNNPKPLKAKTKSDETERNTSN